jgi:thiamine-phosphate pyrophosphorylase
LARLYLVTPRDPDVATFPALLEETLAAGEVASLLIALETGSGHLRQRLAEILIPIAQKHGVAVLVRNDTRAAGRTSADGVHVDTGRTDLDAALKSFHPAKIVGCGGVANRHEAMEAGETEVDYVFFGDVDRPEEAAAERRSLELAEWWVPLFEPPIVVMAGNDLASIDAVVATGAEFVALRDAIWSHPDGPAAALRAALARLEPPARTENPK